MGSQDVHTGFRRVGGFTLIETLICAVIIAILTSISMVSYQGSVDASDFRFAMPKIAERLNGLQGMANEKRAIVQAEFVKGQPVIALTITAGGKVETDQIDLRAQQLLRRPLVFRKYRWPDGSEQPWTFTFKPNGPAEGGTVWLGTGFAEGRIRLLDGRVDWDI